MADENSNGTDLPEQNDERAEHSMEPISPQANEQLVLDDNRVAHTDIQKEMRQSYLDYAISVIVERALPDVRDGMKPVHRRIVYAMYDGGYRPDRGYSKCARPVADVMGNYHHTATSRSTIRWCAWPSRGRCDTRWSTGRATSVRPVTTRPQPCVTPSAA